MLADLKSSARISGIYEFANCFVKKSYYMAIKTIFKFSKPDFKNFTPRFENENSIIKVRKKQILSINAVGRGAI